MVNGRKHFFDLRIYLEVRQLPVEEPAVVRRIIDEKRRRYAPGPPGIHFRTEIICIPLIKPYYTGSEPFHLCKVADPGRIIIGMVQANQYQFDLLILITCYRGLEIGDLPDAGYTIGCPKTDDEGMVALHDIRFQVRDGHLLNGGRRSPGRFRGQQTGQQQRDEDGVDAHAV
jgi:hypothetical protein